MIYGLALTVGKPHFQLLQQLRMVLQGFFLQEQHEFSPKVSIYLSTVLK